MKAFNGSTQSENVTGCDHCLSGSRWTPVRTGRDQGSGTCSAAADRADTACSGDQMNRRDSLGEGGDTQERENRGAAIDFLFYSQIKKEKKKPELNKRVRCPVAEGREQPPVLPKAPVWNIKQRQFPCCCAGDPLGLPPLWAD